MKRLKEDSVLTNRTEYDSFVKNAFAWSASVTPVVLHRVLGAVAYSTLITWLDKRYELVDLAQAPFEFAGIVLGIILVFRLNAGYDRWWEARKWWGSIVNQCRNLAIIGFTYSRSSDDWKSTYLGHVACMPYVFKNSLRDQRLAVEYEPLVGKKTAFRISRSQHMPTDIALRVARLLREAREKGELDGFAFLEAEKQRELLIDALGACERILKTPIPLAIAINTRRFIFVFIVLLPLALTVDLGWMTPLAILLVSYALLSLDQIGIELQHPFDQGRRSHLPLTSICDTIAGNVLALKEKGENSSRA